MASFKTYKVTIRGSGLEWNHTRGYSDRAQAVIRAIGFCPVDIIDNVYRIEIEEKQEAQEQHTLKRHLIW